MKDKVYSFLIIAFLLASLAPTVYEIVHRDRLQPNRAFELVHNFPTDFNFYLSRIRQGIEGRTTVIEQYTSEPHRGSFLHVFYLALGWLGRSSRVPWERGGDVYHVARVVFGALLLAMIAEFCKASFRDSRFVDRNGKIVIENRKEKIVGRKTRISIFEFLLRISIFLQRFSTFGLLAFLLAVTASTWPKLVAYVNNEIVPTTIANIASWRFGGYMPWWSVMDSLQRITFIPHLLVGQTLILFLVMALADRETMRKPGNWIFLGILAFALGIIFPPGLLFVIVTTGLLTILEVFYEIIGGKKIAAAIILTPMRFVPRAGVLGLGIPSLLYLSLMTSFYPWRRLAQFDIVKPLPFAYGEYLLAVGPILPIGAVGLMIALLMRERRMLPAVSWVLAWALLLFIFRFIPQQSPLRFSEMIPHVPLGALTAYFCWYVFQWCYLQAPNSKHQISNKHQIPSIKYQMFGSSGFRILNLFGIWNLEFGIFIRSAMRFIVSIVLMILIAVGFGIMYSSFLWQRDFIDHKMRATYPLVPTGSYVMYPLKDFLRAMKYIQDATSRDTVILSETTAGNYLPVYSGNSVYVGHANTVRAEEKEKIVKEFFSGRMKPDEAKQWLARENLRWIFFGPQEKEDGGVSDLTKVYPFLQQAHKNTFVTIYRLP